VAWPVDDRHCQQPAMNPFTKKVSSDNVLMVTFEDIRAGWEQWILVTSDRHWDSVHSDQAMQRRHLDEAVERQALVIDIGDLFDAMQGRNDKRGSKSAIRPEHIGADYFSRLVETATEWFKPYAGNILMLGTGNHETAIVRHNEINLTWHLGRALNAEGGDIHFGRYAGWIKFQFIYGPKKSRKYLPNCWTYYHHGSGGSSPVTRGVIGTNRRAVIAPQANVVLSGHIHESWLVHLPREGVTDAGRVLTDVQTHVSVPTYKSGDRSGGWEVERGFAPSMKGAVWWRMYYYKDVIMNEFTWAT